ncbi:MAG TPA: hypothetical protein VN845_04065 [Solirubrobacteraceae bacterium]|nr:hypothetical protein [Solirubrobacteraceae bacterium]
MALPARFAHLDSMIDLLADLVARELLEGDPEMKTGVGLDSDARQSTHVHADLEETTHANPTAGIRPAAIRKRQF